MSKLRRQTLKQKPVRPSAELHRCMRELYGVAEGHKLAKAFELVHPLLPGYMEIREGKWNLEHLRKLKEHAPDLLRRLRIVGAFKKHNIQSGLFAGIIKKGLDPLEFVAELKKRRKEKSGTSPARLLEFIEPPASAGKKSGSKSQQKESAPESKAKLFNELLQNDEELLRHVRRVAGLAGKGHLITPKQAVEYSEIKDLEEADVPRLHGLRLLLSAKERKLNNLQIIYLLESAPALKDPHLLVRLHDIHSCVGQPMAAVIHSLKTYGQLLNGGEKLRTERKEFEYTNQVIQVALKSEARPMDRLVSGATASVARALAE